MGARYSPLEDYRQYSVTHDDGPLLSTSAAARSLGVQTTQGVRSLIDAGRLPALRAGRGWLVPEWAVRGRVELRSGKPASARQTGQGPNEATARVRELEDALIALRAAEEHQRRARAHQQEALREWSEAYDVLHDAVGAILIPSSPSGVNGQDN